MRHIRRSSENLEHFGIQNNSMQMIWYIACWISLAVLTPIIFFLSITISKHYDNIVWLLIPKNAKTELRMLISLYYFFTLLLIVLCMLDFLIMTIYLNFCEELQPGFVKKMASFL